jgi:tripartite-type tricarboxylate transporter receptor subunit TctC
MTACAAPALAQQDYFRGKSISLYAGRPPGGGVDSEMRLVGQFLGDHIPGKPSIVPKNMPGAGGIALGNFIYGNAAPDGLSLAVPGRTGFILSPVTGDPNARYDLTKFTWIGSAASSNFMMWVRTAAGVKTVDDLKKKEIVVGGSGSGNSDTVVPELLAKYEGFKFKVVKGYPGTSEEALALQRGEIDAMFTEQASFSYDPIATGVAIPIFQTFKSEHNIPLLTDLATDPTEKALFGLFNVPLKVGLAVVAPPNTPAEITRTLRESYIKAVSSKEYRAEAKKRGFEIAEAPNKGEDIQEYLRQSLSNIPDNVIKEFRSYSVH